MMGQGVYGNSLPPSQFCCKSKTAQIKEKKKKTTHDGEAAALAGAKPPATLLFTDGHGHLFLVPVAPV